MAASKPAKKAATAKSGLSKEERAAAREAVKERARQAAGEDGEAAVLSAIKAMPPADRALAERLHKLIKSSAPGLTSRTWYGMPAYARDDKVVCFFQGAHKFKARYSTLGFSDQARLDDGSMWPTSFALKGLDAAGEARIGQLVRKAVA